MCVMWEHNGVSGPPILNLRGVLYGMVRTLFLGGYGSNVFCLEGL
jgi:hypothetical protein